MARATPRVVALAVAAFVSAPAAAQQPATPDPQTTHQQHQQPTTTAANADARAHLDQAKQALERIPPGAVKGRAVSKIAEIRRHLDALDRSYSNAPGRAAGEARRSPRSSAGGRSQNWSTHVMAIDRALDDLLGTASTTGRTDTPATTGTSGTAGIDPEVRSKLEEVRRHITAFAATASGTSAGAATTSQPTTAEDPTPTPPPNPPSTAASGQVSGSAAAQGNVNSAEARQHLSEARRVLRELTTMPQASQLQGDARTRVSQIINDFNTLITATGDWKTKYGAVEQNVNALLGASTTGGAVGTTGTAGTTASPSLDPALRAKLEEFRTHLQAFAQAAGGSTAGASGTTGAPGTTGTVPTTGTTTAPPSTPPTTTPPGTTTEPPGAMGTGGQTEWSRHLDEIEKGLAAASCDPAKLAAIRTHIAQLRQALRDRR